MQSGVTDKFHQAQRSKLRSVVQIPVKCHELTCFPIFTLISSASNAPTLVDDKLAPNRSFNVGTKVLGK